MKKIAFYILLIIGIVYRFYYQFIQPAFNVDEINLGNNIKFLSYFELLKPLSAGQSAPPLFLWIQKFIISNSPLEFWINIKLLSFLVSIASIYFFLIFIKRHCFQLIFLVPFVILLFNPFVIYNTLALKQYTFDLLGVILLILYFKNSKFSSYGPLFFLVWSLISNIGLFSCVGYLCYLFFNNKKYNLRSFFKAIMPFCLKNYKFIIAVFPYTLYYFWFMSQQGASDLKIYMIAYWSGSFIPLNFNFFYYWIILLHAFWTYFYNMLESIGLLIFSFTFLVLGYQIFKNKIIFLKYEIKLCLFIFGVHLLLNVLKLYPLSDRLFLYLILLFILLTSSALHFVSTLKNRNLILKSVPFIFVSLLIFGYSRYYTFKENDVNSVLKYCKTNNIKGIYVTSKAKNSIVDFNVFTNEYFNSDLDLLEINSSFNKSDYLLTRIHNKLKPNKVSEENKMITSLLSNHRIKIENQFNGFNIYKILK